MGERSKNRILKQYKDHPEALAFIQKHEKEFFKARHETSKFPLPVEKDLFIFDYLFLLSPERKAFFEDILQGLSNQELTKKYNYPNSNACKQSISETKKWLKKKITKYKKQKWRIETPKNKKGKRYTADFSTTITQKAFTMGDIKEQVYLVKVPQYKNLPLKPIEILDTETALYYSNKCQLLAKVLPPQYKDWPVLTCLILDKRLLKKQQDLFKWLGQYRWADKEGKFFTSEIDFFITTADEAMKVPEFMEVFH